MSIANHAIFGKLDEPCPVADGTRVRLLDSEADVCPIKRGATGTVDGGNGSQIFVKWDGGSKRIALLVAVDRWEVVTCS